MSATDEQVTAAIERAKREVLEDIASGRVPATVNDFALLHDYVDANEYGGLCEDGGPFVDVTRVDEITNGVSVDFDGAGRVQEAVHQWLVAGRPAARQEVVDV